VLLGVHGTRKGKGEEGEEGRKIGEGGTMDTPNFLNVVAPLIIKYII